MPDPHEQAVEAMALARCPGRDHSPLLCPALDVYRRQAREQLEAALPHLEQERPDPEWCDQCKCYVGTHTEHLTFAPSRAGEVAEELRELADPQRRGGMADRLRCLFGLHDWRKVRIPGDAWAHRECSRCGRKRFG